MNLEDFMDRLATSLTAHATERVVSRNLKTIPELDDSPAEELKKGRFTLLSTELADVRNFPGCAVHGGVWTILIIGQIKLSETASGLDIERAEFALFTDLTEWLQSPIDPEVNCLEVKGLRQSQQLEKPYGWIAATIEVSL